MKSKTIVAVIITLLVLGGLFARNVIQKSQPNRVTVESMEDGKGIFVGERRPQYKESDPSKWSPETRKRVEEYEASVKAIDEAWNYYRRAHSDFKKGRYEEAIKAFKKAYETDPGGQGLFGKELLNTYERLGQYDEALALLDELEGKGHYKSDYGIKRAQEIRDRLLYLKGGRIDKALEAYERGYQSSKRESAKSDFFLGYRLIEWYEKFKRYDEALALLDELERDHYRYSGDSAQEEAREIRTRLLAAKNESQGERGENGENVPGTQEN